MALSIEPIYTKVQIDSVNVAIWVCDIHHVENKGYLACYNIQKWVPYVHRGISNQDCGVSRLISSGYKSNILSYWLEILKTVISD